MIRWKRLYYDICKPSDKSAGEIGFNDTIQIIVESGDPGGDDGEFENFMQQSLSEWYDGASVGKAVECDCEDPYADVALVSMNCKIYN